MDGPRGLWELAARPGPAFAARAEEAPSAGRAFGAMLALRAPVAFLSSLLLWIRLTALCDALRDPGSALWREVLAALPGTLDPAQLAETLAGVPRLPSLGAALPWMALLAPVGVASLWLHHATFDHAGLLLLGGADRAKGFRGTLTADAEALRVGVLGALAALPGEVPGAPWWLGLLLAPAALWCWYLRGQALAAWHGCPLWKGVAATVLNVLLAGLLMLALLVLAALAAWIAV